MIGLHAITGLSFKLTDLQLMALGDGLISGYDMRLRIDHRNHVSVQRVQRWGTAVDHRYENNYFHGARERRTRLRRGQLALTNAEMFVYYTPAARRQRGLA